ncbi:hypothetical protein GCM10027418_10090 [Mariniluteicoccus endophyticus]
MNPRSRRLIVTGVLVVLLLLVVAGALWQAREAHAAPPPTPSPMAPAFTFSDERIAENSGMARDTGRQLFWVVNDSEDSGRVFAVGPDGKTKGTLEYAAKPVDVEAVAMAGNRLFVADIGDNQAQRDKITVYYFDQPAPNDDRSGSYRAWDFVYPDGAHDAETILVDKNGRIYFVTKGPQGAIYAAPKQLRSNGPNDLTRVADAPAFVTDGTFLPDGRIALRTYVSVVVLDPELYSPVAQAVTPFQRQGEALTVSLDGKTLLLGSEGVGQVVLRIAVPEQLYSDVPSGAPTPPPSPTPTPAPAATSAAVEPTPASDRRGTLAAILMALAGSVVAGVVVALVGRKQANRPTGPQSRVTIKEDGPSDDGASEQRPAEAFLPDPAAAHNATPAPSAQTPAPTDAPAGVQQPHQPPAPTPPAAHDDAVTPQSAPRPLAGGAPQSEVSEAQPTHSLEGGPARAADTGTWLVQSPDHERPRRALPPRD